MSNANTARLLRSYTLVIEPNSHWVMEADTRRNHLRLAMPGERTFDMALTGPGENPADDHWFDGVGTDSINLSLHTTGEVHIRDTDNQGDETIWVICDYEPVWRQVS